jgi:hypothetical protein
MSTDRHYHPTEKPYTLQRNTFTMNNYRYGGLHSILPRSEGKSDKL